MTNTQSSLITMNLRRRSKKSGKDTGRKEEG